MNILDYLIALKIHLTGSRTAAEPETRRALLEALVANERFVPEQYSTHERVMDSFELEGATTLAASGQPSQIKLYLKRAKPPRYDAIFSQSTRPAIRFRFDKKTARRHWPEIFELGDRLADAYQPDFGSTGLVLDAALGFPTEDPTLITTEYLVSASAIHSDYFRNGVGGLGFRTYLGPFVVDQIGEDRLMSLPSPAVVEKMDWGGIKVDLVPAPWDWDHEELLASWRACMEHLKPSGWFAKMTMNEHGTVTLHPPTHEGWSPGGQVR